MAHIRTWDAQTAANNNSSSPDGAPEGMAPSGVNDTIRENMRAVAAQFKQSEWVDFGDILAGPAGGSTPISGTQFSLSGTLTATYNVGRRIRLLDTVGTLYGTITESSQSSAECKVTVALDSGSLTATITGVEVGILSASNRSRPAARLLLASASSGQIIPHNSATNLSFDTVTDDTESMLSLSVITIPAGVHHVRINARVTYKAATSGGRWLYPLLNGSRDFAGAAENNAGYLGGLLTLSAVQVSTGIISVSSGDTINITTLQTSGASLTATTSAGTGSSWVSVEIVD